MINLSKSQMQIYELEQYGKGSVSVLAGSLVSDRYRDESALNFAVQKIMYLHDSLRIKIDDSDIEYEIKVTCSGVKAVPSPAIALVKPYL